MDLTDVRGRLAITTFKVGAVFDVFSRMPLAASVFSKQPTSAEVPED